MRVFLYYPARRTPGGGHKQIRLLARNLRRLGQESFLLHEDAACDDSSFYEAGAPAAAFPLADAGRCLEKGDLLLLPEYRLDQTVALARDWPCRKAVYAQGGFLALLYRPRGGYERQGLEFMIGVSPYIVALGPAYLGLRAQRCFYVPYPVVRGPFAEPVRPFAEKRLVVCCMPRKLPAHVTRVRDVVRGRHPEVPWLEIDGCTEAEVARRLDENALFLSTQDGEGFGLPAIEAMARGCIVAGYAGCGDFPAPYARAENGLWARDRSVGGAIARVDTAIALARRGGPDRERLLAAAGRTLSGFTEERALAALEVVVGRVREREYPVAEASVPVRLGVRGHLQAWRTLLRAPGILRRGRDSGAEAPAAAPVRR